MLFKNKKIREIIKVLTSLSEISLASFFIVNWCFPSGKIKFNVGYFFRLLIIFMCQLKCHEKQDELTYNVGYLSFIDK